jgi:hypothetical protein
MIAHPLMPPCAHLRIGPNAPVDLAVVTQRHVMARWPTEGEPVMGVRAELNRASLADWGPRPHIMIST